MAPRPRSRPRCSTQGSCDRASGVGQPERRCLDGGRDGGFRCRGHVPESHRQAHAARAGLAGLRPDRRGLLCPDGTAAWRGGGSSCRLFQALADPVGVRGNGAAFLFAGDCADAAVGGVGHPASHALGRGGGGGAVLWRNRGLAALVGHRRGLRGRAGDPAAGARGVHGDVAGHGGRADRLCGARSGDAGRTRRCCRTGSLAFTGCRCWRWRGRSSFR